MGEVKKNVDVGDGSFNTRCRDRVVEDRRIGRRLIEGNLRDDRVAEAVLAHPSRRRLQPAVHNVRLAFSDASLRGVVITGRRDHQVAQPIAIQIDEAS